eukprot:TRINITY_DN16088_c0_g1_i2.p1 TRINITY_DN16088_c0_g1~~TRINITY_DN16088_c0_g1_i2.p1  ORF type:complete len:275 (+),score=12.45 TRINITY_DN16088_c0_g1_i2:46-870(+)
MTRKASARGSDTIKVADYLPSSPPQLPISTVSGLLAPSSRLAMADSGVSPAIATTACHALAALLAVLVVYWVVYFQGGFGWAASNPDAVFNIHPPLMLIGFIVVFGEAILAYRLLPVARPTRKAIHLTLNGFALLLGLAGVLAVYRFHALRSIPHFYTLHSWCGLAVMVLFTVQWFLGLYYYMYPGASQPIRVAFMPWHTFLGLFLFVLALATASQGLQEKMVFRYSSGGVDKRGAESVLANLLGLSIFVWGAVVIWVGTVVDKPRDDGYRIIQ